MKLYKGNQEYLSKNLNREVSIVADSPIMQAILDKVDSVGDNRLPVVILGESGTGKKFIAHEIYKRDSRSPQFYQINCHGLPEIILESQLFGDSCNEGLIKKSLGHVLYIEGIDQLPLSLQSRLVRFLETGRNQGLPEIRILASASIDLTKKIQNKEFREDLFAFLSKNLIVLPSLRERSEDIEGLIRNFLQAYDFSGRIHADVVSELQKYQWPGNLTELKNLTTRWSVLGKDGEIQVSDIPDHIRNKFEISYFVKYNPKIDLKTLTNFYILQSLQYFKSKKEAGEALGISVKTIYNKIGRKEVQGQVD